VGRDAMEKKGEESQRGGAYEGSAFITGGGNMRGGFIVPKRVHASHPMSPPELPARSSAWPSPRKTEGKSFP